MYRIALVSFEYPLHTGYGGIASYMSDVAQMFTAHGHHVTVFCGGPADDVVETSDRLRVCVIGTFDKDDFANAIMPAFRREHVSSPFDVVEAAEIYGDARRVKQEFPSLPLVVKLHTPSFLLHRLNHTPISLGTKLRFALGALRRGKLRWLKPDLRILAMREEHESWCFRHADVVTSPSHSLIGIVEDHWGKRDDGIRWLPNPYVLPPLHLSARSKSLPVTGAFLGRLEKRKGFLVLVEALRLLERAGTPVPFVFIAHPHPFPGKAMTMQEWALRRLKEHQLYRFTGSIPRHQVSEVLSDAEFVVLPSIWENFPYACLEAMAQEQLVLASAQGGMADMIQHGVNGLLLNHPDNPKIIADELIKLSRRTAALDAMRSAARRRVSAAFSPGVIYPMHLKVLHEAMAKAASESQSSFGSR